MIASLTGRLTQKSPAQVVVDVHGVGYDVAIPLSTYYALPDLNETTRLHVHTHLRDDAIHLYGFATEAEKSTFLLLTTVTGIGSRLALSVLSTLAIRDLIAAVSAEDVERLATVPGVGKKSAGRIVLELKDKVARVLEAVEPGAQAVPVPSSALYDDASSALLHLGYRSSDVKEVLKRVPAEGATLQDVIRTALQELAKG